MVQSTAEVLEERGKRYGQFINQAGIAQGLHAVLQYGMQIAGKTRQDFHVDELEAINMIVNKLARIYNGDPHYSDSWRDIAGYATLVADRLDNDSHKLIEVHEDDRSRNTENVEPNRTSDESSRPEGHRGQQEDTTADRPDRPTRLSELRRLPVSGTPEQTRVAVRTTPRG